ncbi:non-ribosomal peptide synthetase [Fulvivirga ligni]|uniref:non-ribosomal peptide synthetase n=1 Tax=Fulvivirga ligni TaxID=2904246 RepID=UPI001F2D2713|nr:non-ribosomal peptide synthetase [Fulvivirga ligni]UII23764.1 amino acid adenylation domain-containing protein [Fulvivirga ligni]
MEELLLKLKQLNIQLAVENDSLKLNIPEGVDSPELLHEIKENKYDLIEFISNRKQRKPSKGIGDMGDVRKSSSLKLTPQQTRLFILQELDRDSTAYNLPQAYEIKGFLDKARLQDTFKKIISRHDSLRTRFLLNEDKAPEQHVLDDVPFSIEYYKAIESEVENIMREFVRPFDLSTAPLIRAGLIEVGEGCAILLIDLHHIISDGTSQQILVQDFGAIYNGVDLPAVDLQYGDYVNWYYSTSNQADIADQRAFWLKEFFGYQNQLFLPTDYMRPKQLTFEGKTEYFTIGNTQSNFLRKIARGSNTSLFSILISFYSILLSKLSGITDLAIGTPVAGRSHKDLEKILGMFVNTLSLRLTPHGNINFINYLKAVSRKTISSFENQEYAYENLLHDLDLDRHGDVNPLFNTLMALNNIRKENSSISGLNIRPFEVAKSTAKFDLSFYFTENGESIDCAIEYKTQLFSSESIKRFFNYFTNLIDQVMDNDQILLKDLSLLSDAECKELIKRNDYSDIGYPLSDTLITMFERQVSLTPKKVALVMDDDTITYSELNSRANQIAFELRSRGIGRNDIVCLLSGKTMETVVQMLGVIKSGGAYLPIDITYPENRIRYSIENSGAKLILLNKEFTSLVNGVKSELLYTDNINHVERLENPQHINSPTDLCYVLYTSGTTGNPKGVMIQHKNVVRLLFNDAFQFNFCSTDVWTMFHSHCFDVSVWEIYGALLRGGTLVVVAPEEARDPSVYLEIVRKHEVTVLNQTPTAFYNLDEVVKLQDITLPHIRYVIFAGEALLPAKLKNWNNIHPSCKLVNMYGITEVTVHMTYKEIGVEQIKHSISNIGRPLPTGSIYLLDEHKKPVPPGITGEIFVGGHGVGRGYLNNDELTSSRFISNPFKSGDILYRSGDLARMIGGGELEYLGRSDHQVQLKGFRIELGEIEHQLVQNEYIEHAVVLAKKDEIDDQPFLCAYVVGTKKLETEYLRNYLSANLPFYMIPAYFMQVESIPYTTNNKVDRSKLPAPASAELDNYVAPLTTDQEIMASLWMKRLSASRVGIRDNYFSLGGDSLKAIGIISEINEKLGVNLTIADIYSHQTIDELTYLINKSVNKDQKNLAELALDVIHKFEKKYKAAGLYKEIYESVYPMNGVEKGMVYYSLKKAAEEEDIHKIIYHEQNIYPIPFGSFDFSVFKESLNLLVKKHSTLRKIYDLDYFAHIVLEHAEPELSYLDLSGYPSNMQERAIKERMHEEKIRGTELSLSLIWRMCVIKVSDSRHYLLFDFHHSLFDGWSLSTFMTELNNTYLNLRSNSQYIPELLQVAYQDQILAEVAATYNEDSAEYWRQELEDYHRLQFANTGLAHKYNHDFYDLGNDLRQELMVVATQFNSSFKHLCFAAYIYVMKMITSTNDVVLGIVTNNRPLVTDGEKLLGCFLNTIPFRAQMKEGMLWSEYIEYIESKLRNLKKHEKVPFNEILQMIKEPVGDQNPIFDTSFNFVDFHVFKEMIQDESVTEDHGFQLDNYVNNNTLFDLHVFAHNTGFQTGLTYSTTIIDESLSLRIYKYFKNVLTAFVHFRDQPMDQNTILPKHEMQQLISMNEASIFNHSSGYNSLIERFKEQVAAQPEKIAIKFGDQSMTYTELDSRSNQVARSLREEGVGRNIVVALLMGKTMDTIIGMLGILKAGGAYLPIDVIYPSERIAYMLENSGANIVLTTGEYENVIKRDDLTKICIEETMDFDDSMVEYINTQQDLCYIIYTSGTTGRPKGVMIEHRNVLQLFFNQAPVYDFNEKDVWTLFHSHCFDFSVWEMYGALLYGGTLIIIPAEIAKDPSAFLDIVCTQGVTVLNQTPSAFYKLSDEARVSSAQLPKLRYVIFGGEMLTPAKLASWKSDFPDTRLINQYGITETSVHVTFKELQEREIEANTKSIGRPLPLTSIYLLDKDMKLVPQGVIGEMYVGGAGKSRGYINNEALTASRFIDNPYRKGEKLYSSGDLARVLNDGELEYHGRSDHQVQLRGYRIELGEVENRLEAIPEVSKALVVICGDEDNKKLIGYLAGREHLAHSIIKSQLASHLPEYMIPSGYVWLESFPLTSNGKIDSSSLPDPDLTKDKAYVYPRNETEEKLLSIWADILELNKTKISVETDFFELGGHSITAITLVNKIAELFSVRVPLKDFFSYRTIAQLADLIPKLEKELFISVGKAPIQEYYPLSSAQKRMYFLFEFDKFSTAYNTPTVFEIIGKPDERRLESALFSLVKRHESLRTTFKLINDQPVQQINTGDEFTMGRKLSTAETLAEDIRSLVQPFNLNSDYPIRTCLLSLSDKRQFLFVDMHHIISDLLSRNILIRDFISAYHEEHQAPLHLQYKDYAVWQQSEYVHRIMDEQKAFWISEFTEGGYQVNLPADYSRPLMKSYQGASVDFVIDSEITTGLKKLAENTEATLFMVVLSAYNILLSKMARTQDIVVGSPVSGRQHTDLEGIIGMFVNTLAIRNQVEGGLTVQGFVKEVREKTLKCLENQGYQYEELVDELKLNRDTSRNPLFDVMFVFENANDGTFETKDFALKGYTSDEHTSKFDLTLFSIEKGDKLQCSFQYYSAIFKKETINTLIDCFQTLLRQIVDFPEKAISELHLLERESQLRLIDQFNDTICPYKGKPTIHLWFEEQAEKTPEAFALTFKGESITYKDLNERVNKLARALRARGVRHNVVVGLMVERSVEMITSLLGIMKAGGAYLPLDKSHPEDRIIGMIEDSGMQLLLTDTIPKSSLTSCVDCINVKEWNVSKFDKENPRYPGKSEDLVYVIFTSGSTGKPKGAMLTHGNLTNLLDFHINHIGLDGSSVLQFTTMTFDPSFVEIFLGLLTGGVVHLIDEDLARDFSKLTLYIQQNEICTIFMPSSLLNQIFNSGHYQDQLPNTLRHIVTAGEQVVVGELFKKYLKENNIYLHNHYGPAETHVVTSYMVDPEGEIPSMPYIGRPIQNTQIYILDEQMQQVPVHAAGELYIGGEQVGNGYIGNKELTTSRFIENPFKPGFTLYRTGDLACWKADGNIEFLGRIDQQLKLNGVRIEPGEIESQINTIEGMVESVVILKSVRGDKTLVAYYISERDISVREIRSHLMDKLPMVMVPSFFIKVSEMPVTSTGKLHRASLPDPEPEIAVEYIAPANEIEEELAALYAKVLNLDDNKVSTEISFFEMGGHSLKAITLINGISRAFNVEIALREVFSKQTIKRLADYIITVKQLDITKEDGEEITKIII